MICPVARRRYERLSRRLRNWAPFGYLFPDAVLRLLRRRRESSFCRVASLQGYETDWREQRNDCQREDATSHSSLPRVILHQDGWGPRMLTRANASQGRRALINRQIAQVQSGRKRTGNLYGLRTSQDLGLALRDLIVDTLM
jgi:hypothetical protein